MSRLYRITGRKLWFLISVVLIAVLFCLPWSPARVATSAPFAGRTGQRTPGADELSFSALQRSDGAVRLYWPAPVRPDVLGFNIYRENRGRFTLLNDSPVAGRSLDFRSPAGDYAGGDYVWWDNGVVGMGGARYWIDVIGLNGEAQRFGPVLPMIGGADSFKPARSVTLAELDASASDNGLAEQILAPTSEGRNAPIVRDAGPRAKSSSTQATTDALAQQWLIAAGAALKIAVNRDGWQKIPLADLVAAGSPTSNSQNYRLFADGVEQPILADPDGSLEFYGRGLNSNSTDTRIYWLVSGASGTRIEQVNQGPFDPNVAATSYVATSERRDKVVRFASLINGAGNNWFGPVITATQIKQTLPVNDLDVAGADGLLEVSVQGLTTVGHVVEVRLNGSLMGTVSFNALGSGQAQFAVPMSLLHNGKNLVTLASVGPAGDINLAEYERLTYTRRPRALHDKFSITTNSGQPLRVDGFSSAQIRVWDITDPLVPSELLVGTAADGNGGFAFTLPAGPARTILAQTSVSAATYSATLSANVPSNLNATSNQADFVILTPAGWASSVETLRALRQGQGLASKTVNVEDVYDEFSFGAHDPQALHDFLQRASTLWTTPVRYALLVGDGTTDPRNFLGFAGPAADVMPAMFVNSQFSEAPSDDAIVDFNNDGIADIAVGRFPAKTSAQASAMAAKVIMQDSHPAGDIMNRGALMVVDSNVDYDFEEFTSEVRSSMPMTMNFQTIDRDDGDPNTVRGQIINAVGTGKGIVNFLGHGNVTNWTGGPILTNMDPPLFANTNNHSIFVMLTCLNGQFTDLNSECLGEEVMRSSGGGLAVWASSGETFPFGQVAISQQFYENIFAPSPLRLGDATRNAKLQTEDPDVRRLAILFGDPTMPIR